MKPFSQGLAGATGIGSVPPCGSQLCNTWQINSEPLSLRNRLGAPRRATTRPSTCRTQTPVTFRVMANARHSRVYSSTSDKHLSVPPGHVRSWITSQVHTSFLNRAGFCTQLFRLEPPTAPVDRDFFGPR